MAATTLALAVGVPYSPASADPPPPSNSSDALKQLHDVSAQGEQLAAEYQKAQDDHSAKKADLDRFNALAGQASRTAAEARAQEDRSRTAVDQMAHASYEGAQMNKLSALMLSKSPNEFLDRASTMEVLAKDNQRAIQSFTDARTKAENAERQVQDSRARAAQAEADAARIQADMAQRKTAMDAQIAKVKQQYDKLSQSDKNSMNGGAKSGLLGGPGAGVAATNAALGKQGSPYVWGATGPNSFDCSGLVQWAYKQVGISLPRSTYTQQTAGSSVTESNLQPGDLIFMNGGGHVGIYVGGGKVVHAPTEGENVKVTPYKYIGSVTAMRRVAG